MPHPDLIPFRDLPEVQQMALREGFAAEMARLGNTCSMDEKIARFSRWLAPRGVSFATADLPQRGRS